MIIFGLRSAHISTENLKSTSCPKCNSQGSLWISVFRKHTHLFWVPCFPLNKYTGIECSHCKLVLRETEIPRSLSQASMNIKQSSKGPLWQFSGLILIASFIAYVYFSTKHDESDLNEKMTHPKIGDLYEVRTKLGEYTYYKLVTISDDSIYLQTNKFTLTNPSHLPEINKSENYIGTETEVVYIDSLSDKLKQVTIQRIIR